MSLFGLTALGDATTRFQGYVHGIGARTAITAQLRTAIDERAIAARNIVLATTPADVQTEKSRGEQAHAQSRNRWRSLKQLMAQATDTSDKARALVAQMDRIEQSYAPIALGIIDLAARGEREAAITKLNRECRPLLDQFAAVTSEYAQLSQSKAHEPGQRRRGPARDGTGRADRRRRAGVRHRHRGGPRHHAPADRRTGRRTCGTAADRRAGGQRRPLPHAAPGRDRARQRAGLAGEHACDAGAHRDRRAARLGLDHHGIRRDRHRQRGPEPAHGTAGQRPAGDGIGHGGA